MKLRAALSQRALTLRFLTQAISSELHNARELRRSIEAVRPEVVMVWNGSGLGTRLIAAAERRAPTVYYIKDSWMLPLLGSRNRKGSVRRGLYYSLAKMAQPSIRHVSSDRVIFVSSTLRDQYRRAGVDVRKSAVIGNGLSTELFPARPPHIASKRPQDPLRLLYVGRIVPEKGVSTLIHSLAALRRRPGCQDSRLTIVGYPQDLRFMEELKELVTDLGLNESVLVLGQRPRGQLSGLYAEHDVLVFPSQWEEPFGLALIEAMATGLPVVATPLGGPSTIIRHGNNGLTFRAGDYRDLTAKLEWITDHQGEAAAMGKRASEEVASRYSLRSQIDEIEAALLSILLPDAGTISLSHAHSALPR